MAEAGINHNGEVELAHRMIDVAADAGADAIKFQTFEPERLVTADAPQAEYQQTNMGRAMTQRDMLQGLTLPKDAYSELIAHARERGLLFLSTPFDETCADFLESLGLPAFKIPSGEITNLPFLAYVARKGKPVLLSTGMATLEEVRVAMRVLAENGNPSVALFHCVSCYPTAPELCNLRAMRTLEHTFDVPTGWSDHTEGIAISVAAVALGAKLIEKHFTLDRALPGPDHRASLEPEELRQMVRDIRDTEAALGDGCKQPVLPEIQTAAVARKSLVAAYDLPAGAVLTEREIAILRPGTGLPPARRGELIGRALRVPVRAGTLLSLEMLQ
jgi:N-acetylneuraminate synthase